MSELKYLTNKVMAMTDALNARGDTSQLTIMDDVAEMVFEAGEMGDAVKKRRRAQMGFRRKRNPPSEEEALLNIKKEAGDLFMCFLRSCYRLGINPWECIEMKYNILVEEEGLNLTPISKKEFRHISGQGTLF